MELTKPKYVPHREHVRYLFTASLPENLEFRKSSIVLNEFVQINRIYFGGIPRKIKKYQLFCVEIFIS